MTTGARQLAVTLALIPLVLWADAHTTPVTQLALAGVTLGTLLWMTRRLEPDQRARVWGCVVVSTLGETFCTQVWGAYAYRFGNVPLYVLFGHGMLCAMSLSGAETLRRHERTLTVGAGLIAVLWGLAGLVLPSRPDVEGAAFLPFFLPLLAFSSRRLEHALTFFAASFVELVGTAAGTWEWAATLPVLELPSGSPPTVAAGGYCFFAVFGGLLARAVARWPRLAPSAPGA